MEARCVSSGATVIGVSPIVSKLALIKQNPNSQRSHGGTKGKVRP